MDSAESCPFFCPMNDAIINFADLLDSSELRAEMITVKKFFKGKKWRTLVFRHTQHYKIANLHLEVEAEGRS